MPSYSNLTLSSLVSTQCLEKTILNSSEYKMPWERWLAPLLDTQCLRASDCWIANGHAMRSNRNGHFEYTVLTHNAITEGRLSSCRLDKAQHRETLATWLAILLHSRHRMRMRRHPRIVYSTNQVNSTYLVLSDIHSAVN